MKRHRNRVVNRPITKTSREPKNDREWMRLMRQVIARAEQVGDPRVPALRLAINQGKVARTLKRMRIICETDIQRVFLD